MVDTYLGPDRYVRQTENGWVAGEKSKKYQAGQFVPESYAKSVLGAINFRNRVYGLVENPSEDTPDTYSEAQDIISEFNTLSDELDAADTDQEKEEIEQEINDLRADLGSP